MTNTFYTNVQTYGSNILYRGVENGRRVKHKIEYKPTLYVSSGKPSKYKTVKGEYVSPVNPGTISDCRIFSKKYKDVDNFTIYGNQRYEYSFIYDNSEKEILWDKSLINVCNIDIEVFSGNGFPHPETATEEITAITYKMNNIITAYGCGDFVNTRNDVRYVKCSNEIDILKRFIDDWSSIYPDIITGWNIKFFDIPYIVNRINKVLGESWAKRLSPWNYLSDRTVFIMGKDQVTYIPVGIAVLDYIDMYKKYVPGGNSQESYRLDAICHNDLGERKISYEEYGSIHTLYTDNYQKFLEYNIKDVELVEMLDNKHKVIDLVLTLSYDNKCNYEDVFSQIRMWDVIITNRLMDNNVVVPPTKSTEKTEKFVGAYVKDPQIGMHKWIASFDVASLYPSLIRQYNISPDTIIEPENYTDEQRTILKQRISIDTMLSQSVNTSSLKNEGCTLTPNGQLFKTTEKGFLNTLMEEMFNDRIKYKKEAMTAKKELENVLREMKRRKIDGQQSSSENV